ncbi:MAG TPA: dTDP-4-dehydrorhamnose reductase [bacterium]|nr:dTDP-4-dehydrorhamnose reductase [bacterium]
MIWVVGCRGLLGREVVRHLQSAGESHIGTDVEADISDADVLWSFLRGRKPSWIINCAAYTAVDKAEDNQDAVYRVNFEGPRNLAAIAQENGSTMIHVSTDYVFDGEGSFPYTEDQPVDPVGVYGKSKAEGEKAVADELESHYIVRTAWLFGKHGTNFVHTMLRAMNERDSVGVVSDQRGSPTYAVDLASTLVAIAARGEPIPYGIYHYTNEGETTWYEFAQSIYTEGQQRGLIQGNCVIQPIHTSEFPTKSKRPAYSVLSKDKTRRALGLIIPSWRDALCRFLDELTST